MDRPLPASPLLYRIDHHRRDGTAAVVARLPGLAAASHEFADACARLGGAGERGTLSLVCEVGGRDVPLAARRIAAEVAA